MNVQQVQETIRNKTIIELPWGTWEDWVILTALSDDQTTAYYKRRGMGFTRGSIPINLLPDLDSKIDRV